jgi:hypothetical protein
VADDSRAHWHYAKLFDGYILERSMGDSDYLWLQANIICLLLFILGTAMIIGRPEWFHWDTQIRPECVASLAATKAEVISQGWRPADHSVITITEFEETEVREEGPRAP